MAREPFLKVRDFVLSQGKLEEFNTSDLIPLKAGRNIWVHCDFNNIFPSQRQ